MLTRSLGKIIRGRTTPFSLVTAAILGACLGFAPSFLLAPGLVISLIACLAILNANLFVAGFVGVGAQLLSLALQPTLFAIGRVLLDGPTSGLFQKLINAPVFAYFGFERYVTSGGLLAGLILGTIAGLLFARLQTTLRAKLEAAGRDSERYQKFTSGKLARLGTWLFFGGRKKEYSELSAKRVGNPFRIVGLVGVVALAALAYGTQAILGSAFLQNTLRAGFERVNGATVDLEALDLELSQGRFSLDGLALADRSDLTRDIFRGRSFASDISMGEVLRKRLVMERLVVSEASSGDVRDSPGERTSDVPPDEELEPEPDPSAGEGLSLEKLLADVELWRGRLDRAQRALEQIGWGGDKQDGEDSGEDDVEGAPGLRERLERQAAAWGYDQVIATHLLNEQPRVQVNEFVVEGFRIADFPSEVFELKLENLSSSPALLKEGARVSLESADGDIRFAFDMGERTQAQGARLGQLSLSLRGLAVDSFAGGLAIDGQTLAQGGTVDLDLAGSFQPGQIDLPFQLTLHDSLLSVPGYEPTQVQSFTLPVAMAGSLNAPRFSVSNDELIDSLVAAGKDELARRVKSEFDSRLEDVGGELGDRLEQELGEHGLDLGDLPIGVDGVEGAKDKASDLLRGVLGGKKDS